MHARFLQPRLAASFVNCSDRRRQSTWTQQGQTQLRYSAVTSRSQAQATVD